MHKKIAIGLYVLGAVIITGYPNLGSYCMGARLYYVLGTACLGVSLSVNLLVGIGVLALATVVFMVGGRLEGEA